MKRILRISIAMLAALLLSAQAAQAQRWSVGTNLVDYVNLGTLNAEAGVAVGRHFTVGTQARYNNWTFNRNSPEHQLQNRKASLAAVARCYPWHVWSGWFVAGKMQYQEYCRTAFLWERDSRRTEEGDAFGIGIGAGYDYMLHPHVNLEVGASLWGGFKAYTVYDCPVCGSITGSGSGAFILPDNVFIAIQFIF